MQVEQFGWANLVLAIWLLISPLALWFSAGMTWRDLLEHKADPSAADRSERRRFG